MGKKAAVAANRYNDTSKRAMRSALNAPAGLFDAPAGADRDSKNHSGDGRANARGGWRTDAGCS